MAVPQGRVRTIGVGLLAAQPFGEEDLLACAAVAEVTWKERPQLRVVLERVVEVVDQSVDRRLAADSDEQIAAPERPELNPRVEQPAMPKRVAGAGSAGVHGLRPFRAEV